VDVEDVVGAVEELVLLEELPQPASASRPTASVRGESLGTLTASIQ